MAATAEAFLAKQEPLCDRLAGLLGWSRAETVRLVTFLIGLHDIGKFAKRFQVKHRELYKELGRFPDDPSRLGVSFDHGAGGLRLFDVNSEWFRLPKGPSLRIWRPLVSAVTRRKRGADCVACDPSSRQWQPTWNLTFWLSTEPSSVRYAEACSSTMERRNDLLSTKHDSSRPYPN